MKLIKKIIKTIALFISAIFIFLIIIPFIISGFNISVLWMILQNLFDGILTLEIFKDPFSVGVLGLLVGVPTVVINSLSKIFPKKFNFILLPIISFVLVFSFSIIHVIFFEDPSDMEGLGLVLAMASSIMFLVIFSLFISFIRLRGKNKNTEQT